MANVCQAFLTRSVWESLQASSSLCSCSCSSSASSLTACPFPPRKKRLQQSCWPDTVIHYWYTKPNTVPEEPNVFARKTASLWFHLLPFIMPSATTSQRAHRLHDFHLQGLHLVFKGPAVLLHCLFEFIELLSEPKKQPWRNELWRFLLRSFHLLWISFIQQ